jgi:transcription termination factor Rho
VMDLLTPVGKGQRGLIVAPPRTGKTVLLQQLAAAVAINHPELHLMVLLVDERPEEVTDMKRSVRGEVIASSSDHTTEEHIRLAQLTVDRAKRIAESGGQVLILLDSLTRLARAHNKGSNSGRTMSGGIDIKALDVPKRLFGAARSFDEGGSLTVLATCLIDTGSRMDEIIFQEFKGTGNMEVVLDRRLADRRVWPAIDIQQSGTRKEELLLDAETLARVSMLRRSLSELKPAEAMEQLVNKLPKYPTNAEFLERIGQFQKDR